MNKKALAMILLGLCLPLSSMADVHPYLINGPSAERVDIVVMGDGFTQAEQNTFLQAAQDITEQFLGETPLADYRDYFNVRHLFTPSAESGADDPSENIFRETAFNAAFDCSGISRLLCIDVGSVYAEIDSNLAPGADDIVLVVVNDPQYGGSGGSVSVTSLHPLAGDIALHEIGHSFGRLADEYTADQQTCDFYGGFGGFPSSVPNIEDKTTSALIRWNNGGGPPLGWINPTRQLPSRDELESIPGLYDGAALCPEGSNRYRPTFNSKMRSIGAPWDPINSEQLVKRIHEKSTLIQTVAGASIRRAAANTLSLALGAQDSELSPEVTGASQQLRYEWRSNSNTITNSRRLDTTALPSGVSSVELIVSETSELVRFDPLNYLTERRFLDIAKAEYVALEPNNAPSQSNVLPVQSSISGALAAETDDDKDYIRFFTAAAGRVTIRGAASFAPTIELLENSVTQRAMPPFNTAGMEILFDGQLSAGQHLLLITAVQSQGVYTVDFAAEYPGRIPSDLRIIQTAVADEEIFISVQLGDEGGIPILYYTARCDNGNSVVTAESSSESIVITGLTNDEEYQCAVSASNAVGTSQEAVASGALIPMTDSPMDLPIWLLLEAQN